MYLVAILTACPWSTCYIHQGYTASNDGLSIIRRRFSPRKAQRKACAMVETERYHVHNSLKGFRRSHSISRMASRGCQISQRTRVVGSAPCHTSSLGDGIKENEERNVVQCLRSAWTYREKYFSFFKKSFISRRGGGSTAVVPTRGTPVMTNGAIEN